MSTSQMVKDNIHNEEIRCKDMSVDTSQVLITENNGRRKSRGPI